MDKLSIGLLLACVALIIAGAVGWVLNAIKLFGVFAETGFEITGELVIRGVGVIIPILGAVIGYF